MNHPNLTYELKIYLCDSQQQPIENLKEMLKEQLHLLKVDSYIEGYIDGLDIDFDYESDVAAEQLECVPPDSPFIIYRYDQADLNHIKNSLENHFQPNTIKMEIDSLQTQDWRDGWKESFKPFRTELFQIRPPWEETSTSKELHEIIIEPAMAFGTGQHATTKLCLEQIEALNSDISAAAKILDVGCGTGILSIAAVKLGAKNIIATDIDADAVLATQHNQGLNQVSFTVQQDSVVPGHYDFIFANILSVVLHKILPEACSCLAPGGKVILSGILIEEEQDMTQLLTTLGLRPEKILKNDGWISILASKGTVT